MNGMSEREYAAHSGLSRGAIQKARKAGRLVVYSDGSIDAAASDMRRAEMTDPDQQRRSTAGTSGFSGPADSSSYLKARTALTVYQAQERQLAIQKKKGVLVDRARAGAVIGWDLSAALALGTALGLSPPAMAELLPVIEAVMVTKYKQQIGETDGGSLSP
jgi:hypothetical protein